ncbi:MAG: GtrA family protein [Bradymonadales bacterium]|nr:GtrA family protein [Bradymonadales bacterium]
MIDFLFSWIRGHLGPLARVLTALAPLLVFFTYFFSALAVYLVRNRIYGKHRDPEVESRGDSAILGMRLRVFFVWTLKPLWNLVVRSGIPANALTTLSVLLSILSGVALAAGRFSLGGWLYIFAGICDLLDGRLARHMGQASPRGAALDSVLDRYSDSFVLAGMAWYYRDSWVLLAVLLALVGTSMVSYVRARGEGLGISVKVGLMQRPERIMYLGAANAFSPIVEALVVPDDPHPIHRLAVLGVVLLAISTQLTAIRRLRYLLISLGADSLKEWLQSDPGRMFRTILAASVATIADFLLVLLLVAGRGYSPWLATALGGTLGGVIAYTLNRLLTFGKKRRARTYALRYLFVAFTSILLNTGGVAIFMLIPSMDYRLGWLLVRCAVFAAWNFQLHRNYVFAPVPTHPFEPPESEEPPPPQQPSNPPEAMGPQQPAQTPENPETQET